MSNVSCVRHAINIDLIDEFDLNLTEYQTSDDARNAVTWSCSVPDLGTVNASKTFNQLDREEIIARKDRASMLGKMAQLDLHAVADDSEELSRRKPGVLSISDRNLLGLYGARINALAHAKFIIHAAAHPPAAISESEDEDASLDALVKGMSKLNLKSKSTTEPESDEDASIGNPIVSLSSFDLEDKSTLYIADWAMNMPDLDSLKLSGLKQHYIDFERSEQEAISERDRLLQSLACTYIQRSAQAGKQLVERKIGLLPADADKMLKTLEARSEAFRYAQYIILGKRLSKSPPLDKAHLNYCSPQKAFIKYVARYHDVQYLVHFTQASNVKSIVKNGLLARESLDSKDLRAAINDEKRLDGVLNGTSLSISFPNDKCFYTMKMKAKEHRRVDPADWAVLLIDRSVLWKKDCLFNYFNAADRAMTALAADARRTFLAYEAMFEDVAGPNSREAQKLKASDPTNVQAEVLVCADIEPEYIQKIIFNSDRRYREHVNAIDGIELSYEKYGVFGKREWRR